MGKYSKIYTAGELRGQMLDMPVPERDEKLWEKCNAKIRVGNLATYRRKTPVEVLVDERGFKVGFRINGVDELNRKP